MHSALCLPPVHQAFIGVSKGKGAKLGKGDGQPNAVFSEDWGEDNDAHQH